MSEMRAATAAVDETPEEGSVELTLASCAGRELLLAHEVVQLLQCARMAGLTESVRSLETACHSDRVQSILRVAPTAVTGRRESATSCWGGAVGGRHEGSAKGGREENWWRL